MRTRGLGRHALTSCVAAALLAGCGGSQPPMGAPGAMPQTSSIATHVKRGKWWMMRGTGNANLLHASDSANGKVLVLTYPQGKIVGTLSGFQYPLGLCSDKAGDVFVVDAQAQAVVEYAHGGSAPIATLNDSGNYPDGCSVDPTTGNLAVSGGNASVGANVAIFANATGIPTTHTLQMSGGPTFAWCTYDDRGNLFLSSSPLGFTLFELAGGSDSFAEISFDKKISGGPNIQWDGKYLAIGDPYGSNHTLKPATVYRVRVSGSTATVVKTIELKASKGAKNRNPGGGVQFWIQGSIIVNPVTPNANLGLWPYPSGGRASSYVALAHPILGLTVSLAPGERRNKAQDR